MSGGKRRGPVGLGYMPKGGAKAAQRHNESVMPTVVAPAPVPVAVAVTDEGRTDGRASGRSAWSRPDRVELVTVAVVASAGTAALVSGLLR